MAHEDVDWRCLPTAAARALALSIVEAAEVLGGLAAARSAAAACGWDLDSLPLGVRHALAAHPHGGLAPVLATRPELWSPPAVRP